MNKNQSFEGYFSETKIPLRLACANDSGWPIVLSLWFLYEDGFLYCATPRNAIVVAYLLAEPRCSYEVAADQPPYCGVRGRALAVIDENRGLEILERLLYRYLGGTDNKLAQKLLTRSTTEVAIKLELISAYSWNFSNRMADSLIQKSHKICPE